MFGKIYKSILNEVIKLKSLNESNNSSNIKDFALLIKKNPVILEAIEVYSDVESAHIPVEKYAIDFIEETLSKLNESKITQLRNIDFSKFNSSDNKDDILDLLDSILFENNSSAKKFELKSNLVQLLKEDRLDVIQKSVTVFKENYDSLSESSKSIVNTLLLEDKDNLKNSVNKVILDLLDKTKISINESNDITYIKNLMEVNDKLTNLLGNDFDNETIATIIELSESFENDNEN
jgi:hypothetical protein